MLDPNFFLENLLKNEIHFFTGVPDSLLKHFCASLTNAISATNHIINCNEGAALALASGYHLATNKIPLVYLQNSGLGNLINPYLSLTHPRVYRIPILYLIGWRGEPNIKDEPQHLAQGACTTQILEAIGASYDILNADTAQIEDLISLRINEIQQRQLSHFFLVQKNTFSAPKQETNPIEKKFELTSRSAIELVLTQLPYPVHVVASTGMISRELSDFREKTEQSHKFDFLNIGAMGYCSQIALGIALQKPHKKILCLDGDGSLLMHMGNLAILGAHSPKNLIHILLNNEVHNSVGGQATVANKIDFCKLAQACGYKVADKIDNAKDLINLIDLIKNKDGPIFLEIKINPGNSSNLSRPASNPLDYKNLFMKCLLND